ncbi:MAG: hypothetical protein M1436_09915, partial [Acidobacteria bacterium]|nr:hypothetical protein [Acidobacteriota bacterium]
MTDPGVITTRQAITPAGTQAVFQGRVYGVAFGEDARELWVVNGGQVLRMDWMTNRVLERATLGGSPGLQGIRFDPESGRAYVSNTIKGKVRLLSVSDGNSQVVAGEIGSQMAGAVAFAPPHTALVPLMFDDKLAIIDVTGQRQVRTAPTGIAPFAAAVNREGTVAYVSNWGGRRPGPGDLTAPTGLLPTADQVVVDGNARGPRRGPAYPHHCGRAASHGHRVGRAAVPGLRGQRQLRFSLGDRCAPESRGADHSHPALRSSGARHCAYRTRGFQRWHAPVCSLRRPERGSGPGPAR